ncbi:MAG TPA: hypothetical protein ENI23_02035 [bacterium]|nr:hypothetical protein [bacterium]
MTDNYFHILRPYFSAWMKYNWPKDDFGLSLAKDRIDLLASQNAAAIVRYGKSNQEYTISARKARRYPVEQIKDYGKWVYVVPKSALNYRAKKIETLKDLAEAGIFG